MIVLIVDDDAEDREIFCACIKKLSPSTTCIEAVDGEAGFQLIEGLLDAMPDFVFIDIMMPKMGGVQLLREIRKNKYTKDLPVIMYSESFLNSDIEECKKLTAGFLQKPFSENEMTAKLSKILFD